MVVGNTPKKGESSGTNTDGDSSREDTVSQNPNAETQSHPDNSDTDQETSTTMPIGNTQIVSLKDAAEVVPKFDGTNISVYEFIDSCEEALLMLPQNVEQNLVRIIRTKITGEAKRCIQGIKFDKLESLTTYLKELYAPEKTINQVRQELGTLVQGDDEDVIKYINRVREIENHIIEAYKTSNDGQISEADKNNTEKECIESFFRWAQAGNSNKNENVLY